MPYDRHREPVNLITHLATLRWFATPTGQGYTLPSWNRRGAGLALRLITPSNMATTSLVATHSTTPETAPVLDFDRGHLTPMSSASQATTTRASRPRPPPPPALVARIANQAGNWLSAALVVALVLALGRPSAEAKPFTPPPTDATANVRLDAKPFAVAQACPPQLQKLGLCGNKRQGGGGANPTRPGNTGKSKSARVVCINGARAGSFCVCPGGGKPRRVGASTYKCSSGPRPCQKGTKRIGKLCVPTGPSNSAPAGTSSTTLVCFNGKTAGRRCLCANGVTPRRTGRNRYICPDTPPPCGKNQKRMPSGKCVGSDDGSGSDRIIDRCIGGRVHHGNCRCTPPSRPMRIGRKSYRCVTPPCPGGTVRMGRLCVPPVGIHPEQPPPGSDCHEGWRLRNGKCHRIVGTACPEGTERRDEHCVRLPPSGTSAPPPAVAGPPLPQRTAAAASDDSPYEPDEVLVEIPGASPQQVANRLINAFGLVTLSQTRLTILGTSLYRFRIPAGSSVEDAVASLSREPGVETTQPNWRYKLNDGAAAALPADAAHSAPANPPSGATLPQYALDLIDARKANAISRGADVLIAVIDTGIEENHPEIAGTIAARYNTFPSQAFEPDTHATAIASIITAKRELAGIAPDARILAVQAFTPTVVATETPDGAATPPQQRGGGNGTSQRILTGLNWALLKGARVINMSFAGPPLDELANKMIVKGSQAGMIFVAAAGNAGPEAPPAYPAAHPSVISVTAIDDRMSLYTHANIGAYIDIAAPGVDVMAAAKGGAYDLASGTSFAAAHVSAVVALILAKSPAMSRERIVAQLAETASDLGPPGRDDQFGAGCINALRAIHGMALQTSGGRQ